MSGALLGLFGTALAAALCDLLLPEGAGGTRRALHFLTALCVLLLFLSPLPGLLREAGEVSAGDFLPAETEGAGGDTSLLDAAVAARSAAALEAGLYDYLEAAHGIARADCRIALRFSSDGSLARVAVTLSGRALLVDPRPVEEDLRARLHCETEVR